MGKNPKAPRVRKDASASGGSGVAALAQTSEKPKTVRVTYPGGRVEVNPDDGRSYPVGAMLQFGETWTIRRLCWPNLNGSH